MLTQVQSLIQQGIDDGLHLGAQVCVSRGGEIVEELALGRVGLSPACQCGADAETELQDDADPALTCGACAMTNDSIALWMSSGKPITAVAILQLVEHGEIELDDPVAEFLPTFASHCKQGITVRHLLTHTAGIRTARFKFPQEDWETIIAAVCDAQPEWEAGEQGGYHTQTTWFLLGELVRLVDGRAIDQYVRDEVFLPLGMNDSWMGMPPEIYRGYEQAGKLFDMPNTYSGKPVNAPMMSFDWSTRPRPGGNCMGPIRELVMFYEMLLGGGERDGVRLLQAKTVAQMTSRQREGMHDETFKQTVDWGLGVAINSAHHAPGTSGNKAWHRIPYGYGPHASPDTFGHGGAQSSIAFADPEYQLAVGMVFNGMPGEAKHQQRANAVLEALYSDLGLV